MDKINLPPKWSQPLSGNPGYCTNSPACKIHSTCDGGCPGPQGKAYGMPAIDPETAPSATETPEQPTPGLCQCLGRRLDSGTPASCICVWGALIAQLRQAAYQVAPDQALIALPHIQMRLNVQLAELRKEALQARAAHWTGTVNEFMRRFELTRSTYDRLGLKVPRG